LLPGAVEADSELSFSDCSNCMMKVASGSWRLCAMALEISGSSCMSGDAVWAEGAIAAEEGGKLGNRVWGLRVGD
jgi:hypothetical protein